MRAATRLVFDDEELEDIRFRNSDEESFEELEDLQFNDSDEESSEELDDLRVNDSDEESFEELEDLQSNNLNSPSNKYPLQRVGSRGSVHRTITAQAAQRRKDTIVLWYRRRVRRRRRYRKRIFRIAYLVNEEGETERFQTQESPSDRKLVRNLLRRAGTMCRAFLFRIYFFVSPPSFRSLFIMITMSILCLTTYISYLW